MLWKAGGGVQPCYILRNINVLRVSGLRQQKGVNPALFPGLFPLYRIFGLFGGILARRLRVAGVFYIAKVVISRNLANI